MSEEKKNESRRKKKKKKKVKEKNQLKSVLKRESLSQADLARATGLSDKTINNAYKHQKVSGKTKRKIIKALNEVTDSSVYSIEEVFPKSVPKET